MMNSSKIYIIYFEAQDLPSTHTRFCEKKNKSYFSNFPGCLQEELEVLDADELPAVLSVALQLHPG